MYVHACVCVYMSGVCVMDVVCECVKGVRIWQGKTISERGVPELSSELAAFHRSRSCMSLTVLGAQSSGPNLQVLRTWRSTSELLR